LNTHQGITIIMSVAFNLIKGGKNEKY